MTTSGATGRAWALQCEGRDGLAGFTPAELEELADLLGRRRIAAGGPLMQAAEPVERIGFVLRGAVELTRGRGSRRVVLQVLRAGDV